MAPQNGRPGDESITKIYLVRHGVTTWNLDKRFQGHLDIPLSDQGLEQAAAVGQWLAAQEPGYHAIYSSDLRRAAQTAETIGRTLGVKPVLLKELREIHCGDWQGLSVDEVEARYPGQLILWDRHPDSFKLPGGESIPEVQGRLFGTYRELAAQHAGETLILVSHGAALAALQAAIEGWGLVETWADRRARLGNTGVSRVEIDAVTGAGRITLMNFVGHLEHPTGLNTVLDRAV